MTRVTPPISAHQQRQLSFILEFQVELVYLPGKNNIVADVMSRLAAEAVVNSVESSSVVPENVVRGELHMGPQNSVRIEPSKVIAAQ